MTSTKFTFHTKINVTQILLHWLDEAKLHNGMSHDFHFPTKLLERPDYAEEDMDEACSMHVGKKYNSYRILVLQSEGKVPLGTARRRGNNNIKMYLTEIGWESLDWIHMVQDWDQWWTILSSAPTKWQDPQATTPYLLQQGSVPCTWLSDTITAVFWGQARWGSAGLLLLPK